MTKLHLFGGFKNRTIIKEMGEIFRTPTFPKGPFTCTKIATTNPGERLKTYLVGL